MSTHLFEELERRVLALVEELETSREQNKQLTTENQQLRHEMSQLQNKTSTESEKLESLLSLLDGVSSKSPVSEGSV